VLFAVPAAANESTGWLLRVVKPTYYERDV
jgi:hypothetical protein